MTWVWHYQTNADWFASSETKRRVQTWSRYLVTSTPSYLLEQEMREIEDENESEKEKESEEETSEDSVRHPLRRFSSFCSLTFCCC